MTCTVGQEVEVHEGEGDAHEEKNGDGAGVVNRVAVGQLRVLQQRGNSVLEAFDLNVAVGERESDPGLEEGTLRAAHERTIQQLLHLRCKV